MILAITCSQCREGILGLDEDSCTFGDGETIESKQFLTLTPVGWAPVKYQSKIECPKCKSGAILVDIDMVWREEKGKRKNKRR